MSTSHILWPSIELLHNCVRTLRYLAEQGHPLPVVEYRAKIKLHGTNCGVQITADGVVAQSRTQLLSATADYKGFATWVQSHHHFFSALPNGYTVFGEWCGPGVEKSMAISQAKGKRFAVFAIQTPTHIIYEPDAISAALFANPSIQPPAELDALPWEPAANTSINFASAESLEHAASTINQLITQVEQEDPWVKRTFGFSGLGEGLVFYPVTVNGAAVALTAESLSTLVFKAKGEKHRSAATKEAVQVEASVVASVQQFVELMVTPARLEQGVAQVCNGTRDPKLTGTFVNWVANDVKKESIAELEASGLTWAQVDKAVQAHARTWYRSTA